MNDTELVATLFPRLRPRAVRTIDEGWDSLVLDVDGDWIVRIPRRAEVARSMEMEGTLLRELEPALPVAVPRFELVAANGVRAVDRKLGGSPLATVDRAVAAGIGRFLAALHAFPVARAIALGVPGGEPGWWREQRRIRIEDFRARALPLLQGAERLGGEALLDAALTDEAFDFEPSLVHGDLGPEHVLCADGHVTAVIDWTDARIGDPALDLSWLLHGTPPASADEVLTAYGSGADSGLHERALVYHRLGPWYEVTYGLDEGRRDLVERGLAGIRSRLPRSIA